MGNDWETTYTYNGKTITNGEQLTVYIASTPTIMIDITVTEKDKIPDIGTGSISVTLNKESETKTVISVTENGGCYQGNRAQWEITCKTKFIKMN